ncbi:hypothetical protein GPK34_00525 [Secundilactobacillus kimchicus]|uniref:hypothetical protein n=1 Tax=Secundilactobacillus kimchicus TaxID=528209 RepID=UPI001C01551E|nr:hypothetical protein [Secundilactobacillus kimchicus]MBT9670522.1 hypothetical protein [Secundilactobacillus kimchicus]
MDYAKILEQQLQASSGEDNNTDSDRVQRKLDVIKLNSKQDATVRIVPLGSDRWFAYGYREIFLTLNKKDGSTYNMPVRFPMKGTEGYNEADDKLYQLVRSAIRYNYDFRDKTGATYDAIKLQENNRFYSNVSERYEVVAVNVDDNGQMEMNGNYPAFRGLRLAKGAYNALLSQIQEYDSFMGQPFPDALHFVNASASYPVHFKYISGAYQVNVKANKPLNVALPQDYLQRTEDGTDFVHMDDPALFEQPLMYSDPEFYETVYNQLKKSVDAQLSNLENGGTSQNVNPYATQAQQQMPSQAFQGNVNQPNDQINITANSLPTNFGGQSAPQAPVAQPAPTPAPTQAQPAPFTANQAPQQPTPAPQAAPQAPAQPASGDPFAANAIPDFGGSNNMSNQDVSDIVDGILHQ